jgi:glycosyltransferase involved in cell wall biosynthesis
MTCQKPFFSVVIPLYNKENYIKDTIASVLGQRFEAFEVIIVNDGSEDESLSVVKTFADPRIKVFSTKNGGVSSARNYGIAKAQCEYVALLDADDHWTPTYLEEMKQLIDFEPDCGFYVAAYKIIDRNKVKNVSLDVPPGIIKDYFKVEIRNHIALPSATILRKSAFNKVGGFPIGMTSGEDGYLAALLAINFKAAYHPKVLVVYNKLYTGMALRENSIDTSKEKWSDLYLEGDYYRNEFIAIKAIRAGIRYALNHHQPEGLQIESFAQYTNLYKHKWKYLFIINRVPYPGIVFYKKVKSIIKPTWRLLLKFGLPIDTNRTIA